MPNKFEYKILNAKNVKQENWHKIKRATSQREEKKR